MIAVTQVSKHFGGVKAVDDISFEVKEGENLILLGTSGCGKTTTLKMINRLVGPSAGSIKVNGVDITKQSPETLRRGIGYVLQHNSLFPHYTVAENIAVVPNLLQWDKNRIRSRTEELLYKLNLSADKQSAYPHELSGGQQQRVNIARALAADPPVLLMDEPFGALDTITRANISREFSEIEEFMRKTIVMVTHDVQEAFLLGDRICLMKEGKIIQSGKPLELLFHPANDFVKEFLSASYLRLALGAIKVQDIWDKLNDTKLHDVTETCLSANESLWNAMEFVVKNNNSQSINIQNKEGQMKTVNKEELFKAFSEYRIA
jgi:osmoprotectant transport system ATP-binding protein